MKYINIIFGFILFLSVCSFSKKSRPKIYPPYKLIIDFSTKIKPQTGLVLDAYGINFGLPKDYEYINRVANFKASYSLKTKKEDLISLGQARKLIIFLTENLIKEINSNPEVRPDLDVYPANSDFVRLSLCFWDEIKVQLGQGVAQVYLYGGRIYYEGFEIEEYTGKYPTEGKHYLIHEESYAEAAEIVKVQGPIFEMPKDATRPKKVEESAA